MKKNAGVTLLELIIVISIIGVLVVVLGFSYQGWTANYKVESQTKELYADLMDARLRALYRNRMHFVDFQSATSYRIREDTNEDNNSHVLTGDTILPTFPKRVQNTLNCNGSGILNTTFTFDTKGLTSPNRTIWITSSAGATPDYDCIVLFSTRINMGKWDEAHTKCEAK